VFQKLTYCYRSENDSFGLLEYPIDEPIERYLQWGGHSVEGAAIAGRLWGRCMFDIPMPSFLELFKVRACLRACERISRCRLEGKRHFVRLAALQDHLVAPFFLFQVFCLVLWSLDEYWYYSGMTLCMLLLFEGMQCYQRQNSLEMLRAMRRSRYPIQVYRGRQWLQVSTEDLVPGDIVSLRTPQPLGGLPFLRQRRRGAENDVAFQSRSSTEEYLVPCDAILLRGTCVVNESMLTGESVPQMKEGAVVADDQHALVGGQVVDPLVRRHIVYGGTQIIQHSHENGTDAQVPTAARAASVPVPPDQGCPAVVLRTGFATTQGELMRTILFASETVNAHAKESLVFIVVLLMFAILASAYVLNEVSGMQSTIRDELADATSF
jgi:cation-transporting ATPase 13A1